MLFVVITTDADACTHTGGNAQKCDAVSFQTCRSSASSKRVTLHFSRSGKPVDDAFVESFNGRFRDECLKIYWFRSLLEARIVIESWRRDYNTLRSHSVLGTLAGGAQTKGRDDERDEDTKVEDKSNLADRVA